MANLTGYLKQLSYFVCIQLCGLMLIDSDDNCKRCKFHRILNEILEEYT